MEYSAPVTVSGEQLVTVALVVFHISITARYWTLEHDQYIALVTFNSPLKFNNTEVV